MPRTTDKPRARRRAFSAGGSRLITRSVTERIGANWGQPLIIETRARASGNIGIQSARSAPPDGYSMMMIQYLDVNPVLDQKSKSGAPISSASRSSDDAECIRRSGKTCR